MFESRQITDDEYRTIIQTIRQGYVDNDGITRKPNEQVADILVLEANLGCRINDIISLTTDNFYFDKGEMMWKIHIIEQKTGKERRLPVPDSVKSFIDEISGKNYTDDERLFSIKAPAVWKALKICTATLGYECVSCHSLRKFWSMNLYRNSNYNVELVSQALNHSSVAVTRKYLKISSKEMEDAISKSVNIA